MQIFSIFITLFFPKANYGCDLVMEDIVIEKNIKSKKNILLIYVFWTFFFGLVLSYEWVRHQV